MNPWFVYKLFDVEITTTSSASDVSFFYKSIISFFFLENSSKLTYNKNASSIVYN